MNSRTIPRSIGAVAILVLAGCGGGGGGGSSNGGGNGGFTIGGTVAGLASGTLTLRNNGGADQSVVANGAFTLASGVANGTGYKVIVVSQPSGHSCTVAQGVGLVAGANVSTIAVACAQNPGGLSPPGAVTASYDVKTVMLSWSPVVNATHYRVIRDPDGRSGYTQIGPDLSLPSYADVLPVHLTDWINARYMVAACNGLGCSYGGDVTALDSVKAIGFIKASNTGVVDNFGWSVALSTDGETMAVGARRESSSAIAIDGDQSNDSAPDAGAVYIFTLQGGLWAQQAYVKASNTGTQDQFGWSIALSADGNSLAVGAPFENSSATGVNSDESDNSAPNAGAAYVYVRTAGTWSQQAYIKASNTGAGDRFGASITLSADGNTLAVGADLEDSNATGVNGNQTSNSAPDSGAAYVFTRTANTWSQQAYVKASNARAQDQFGLSVALARDGNTLAVGAPAENSATIGINGNQTNNDAVNAGAAYVFVRSGAVWSQQSYVKASNTRANNFFGQSIALSLSGDTLVVGAYGENSLATGVDGDSSIDTTFAGRSGAAYVYARTGAVWSQQAYIKASNSRVNYFFGWSVSLADDGNTLAIGAYGEDGTAKGINGDQLDHAVLFGSSGAVYVFTRAGGVWAQKSYVKASNTRQNSLLGQSVSLSGDGATLAVGAHGEKSSATGINGSQTSVAATGAGAVYLY